MLKKDLRKFAAEYNWDLVSMDIFYIGRKYTFLLIIDAKSKFVFTKKYIRLEKSIYGQQRYVWMTPHSLTLKSLRPSAL